MTMEFRKLAIMLLTMNIPFELKSGLTHFKEPIYRLDYPNTKDSKFGVCSPLEREEDKETFLRYRNYSTKEKWCPICKGTAIEIFEQIKNHYENCTS